MNTLVLSERDVREMLPMRDCIEVTAKALSASSAGDVALPLRTKMMLPEGAGLLGMMPAWLGEPRCFGIKVVSVMPGNHGSAYDAHQGAVLLFEPEHGCLVAVMDASSITALRTAAASAVATRALALEGAGDLAILGSGVQARSHLEAMAAVRKLRRVRIHSRNAERARVLAERESKRIGIEIEVSPTAHAAVEGADIVCTTTSSKTPVLLGAWLSPGTHVNAVGACLPTARELDTEAVLRSRLFTDRRESALHEAGDFIIAKDEGAVTDEHIVAEVGEVLLGRRPGRTSAADITLFESLGIGVEDLAVAHHLLRESGRVGRGMTVEWGGLRDGIA
jgi:ornithine cyclodeaminase